LKSAIRSYIGIGRKVSRVAAQTELNRQPTIAVSDLSSPKDTSELVSPEDSKSLLALCRAGKLYEIERWIAAGKSIRTSAEFKKSPLRAAIELGFHSLIEC